MLTGGYLRRFIETCGLVRITPYPIFKVLSYDTVTDGVCTTKHVQFTTISQPVESNFVIRVSKIVFDEQTGNICIGDYVVIAISTATLLNTTAYIPNRCWIRILGETEYCYILDKNRELMPGNCEFMQHRLASIIKVGVKYQLTNLSKILEHIMF